MCARALCGWLRTKGLKRFLYLMEIYARLCIISSASKKLLIPNSMSTNILFKI